MEKKRLFLSQLFPTLQNKDEFYQRLIDEKEPVKKILASYFLMVVMSFLYGIVMGSYHSLAQAISAGIKVPVLFSIVLLICFPAFFIIQFILGSKLKLNQMISIILTGFVLSTAIMVSFTPIVVFFLLTGGNYYFLQLLHIAIIILAGIFGMKTIIDALRYSCEQQSIYPKIGVDVFKFWVVILVFVGIQMAWNLRPFLGDRGKPFKLFREYEGNFYAALIYSVDQLIEGEAKPNEKLKESSNNHSIQDTQRINWGQ